MHLGEALLVLVSLSTVSSVAAVTGDGCIALPSVAKYLKTSDLPPPTLQYTPVAQGESVQGLHLAIDGPNSVRVTWLNPVPHSAGPFNPQCLYGVSPSNLSLVVVGSSYSYTAGLFAKTLNSAVLDVTKIPCGQPQSSLCVRTLWYSCGDKAFGWSPAFQLQHQDSRAPLVAGPQIAVVGDMGVPHGFPTIEAIAKHLTAHAPNATLSSEGVQLLLHAGDISYADHYDGATHNNSWVWEDYMSSLQPVAARVPYMTSPGNHESQFNFAAYLNWLPMPAQPSGSDSPFWFSFDYLGVHVLVFSTEHDFSPNSTQHRWMAQDLVKANQNRNRVPWVVVMGHRPLYCSSFICWERCHDEAPRYRSYLEDLLYQQHVDVVVAGHNHQYERSYPVYNEKSTQKNYTNPQAPVYVVNGAAGNPELNDPTFVPGVEWRANYRATMRTGFLLMAPSATQLAFSYVMSDENEVVDSFVIVRDTA